MYGPAFSQRMPPVQNITIGRCLRCVRQPLDGGRKVAEVIEAERDGILERAGFHFVIVAGIEQRDGSPFIEPALEVLRRKFRRRSLRRFDARHAEGDDLAFDLHEHAIERLLVARADFGREFFQAR